MEHGEIFYVGLITIIVFSTASALPPYFDSEASQYVRVPENIPVGSVIKTFNVTDPDSSGNVRIAVSDPTTIDYVNFTQTHGNSIRVEVVLKQKLDRDRGTTNIQLKFQAADAEGNMIYLVFDVYISDVNDEYPEFKNEPYRLEIPENEVVNTTWTLISAKDIDAGYNGLVTYSMESNVTAEEYAKTFSISNATGVVRLTKPLDYEANSYYQFNVTAQDMTPPYHRVYTILIIRVRDVQDTPPFFTGTPYRATIKENFPIGTSVMRIAATDGDPSVSNKVDFQIKDGDCSTYFSINSLGELVTAKPIDREAPEISDTDGVCSLTVKAFEVNSTGPQYGNTSAETNVTVIIEDVNDNPPEFVNSSGTFMGTVEENSPYGVPVTFTNPKTLFIRDLDQTGNSILLVHLTNPAFIVYPSTVHGFGSLSIRVANGSLLDREKTNSYSFQIIVTDGMHETRANITVLISDLDDNSPVFEAVSYVFNVSEAASIGTVTGMIRATDSDSGINGRITYSLSGAYNRFEIGKDDGTIRLIRQLDRETANVYHLVVTANDGGGRSSTTTVIVHVIDENDNVPVFEKARYRATIMENDAKYNITPVIRVKAWDVDIGANADITYSLRSFSEAWMASNLTINSTTGAIYLKSPVDFELLQNKSGGSAEVTLDVVARDQGSPALSTWVPMTLVIQDEIETLQASPATSIQQTVSVHSLAPTQSTPASGMTRSNGAAQPTTTRPSLLRSTPGAQSTTMNYCGPSTVTSVQKFNVFDMDIVVDNTGLIQEQYNVVTMSFWRRYDVMTVRFHLDIMYPLEEFNLFRVLRQVLLFYI